ncbi:MAG TPA: isoprenylcysteine carboxylmethyltransferase family protein [Deltaproteobacteria bacterium]|nr:isoprenylcysteine carboxylmethyltransferase family protein [Deltaproteobacteria bacterium]
MSFLKSMDYLLIFLSYLLGGISLFLLVVFLYFGPLEILILEISEIKKLMMDFMISLLFFIQHSGMVRKRFHDWMEGYVDGVYHGVLFTICSGLFLLLVIVLWQPSNYTLFSIEGSIKWFFRLSFILSILGFYWGIRALGTFDLAGINPILNRIRRIHPKPQIQNRLIIRGPYRWVRHPLYLFSMVMFWSNPDFTLDRLLFNLTWTIWIVIGTILEERDLMAAFGDPYCDYQRRVPMLLPRTIRPAWRKIT